MCERWKLGMNENAKDTAYMDDDVYKKVAESAKQHWISFLMLFLGMWTSLGAIGVGVDVGTKLTPWKASLAFFLGYVICMIFGYLVGEIGRREGLATPVLCDRPFSKYGKIVPVFIVFLIAGAFIGVQADAIARIGMSILGISFNEGFDLKRGLVAAALCSLMMFTSYRGISQMKLISWISVPIFSAVLILSFIFSVNKYPGGLPAIMTIQNDEVSFTSVMFLGVALYAGFSAFMPDVSRFISSRSGLIKAMVIGYIASTFIPIWGVVVGAAEGGSYWTVFSQFGVAFSIFAVIGLFLAQWTTNDVNAFSSGLALSTIFTTLHEKNKRIPRLTRKQGTLVPAIIGVVLAFVGSGAIGAILGFVGALGAWLVPMAGVLIGHYYVIEKGGKKVETKGLAGLISAVSIGLLTQFGLLPMAAITSIVGSILLYIILYYGVEKPLLGVKMIEEDAQEGIVG